MDVVFPKPGRYVLAVSGGVDSMVLLDLLAKRSGIELVVAHFDHGIRQDSAEDKKLVEAVAGKHHVPFVCLAGKLGSKTGEAKAREARYGFLRQVMKNERAQAIITAHHQDDVIETTILNMLRGTGRKGISSLKNQDVILRPLLNVPKKELIKYAKNNNLKWHEDSTNRDTAYLRNYVRHNIVPKLDEKSKNKLLQIVNDMQSTNKELDTLLVKHLQKDLNRQWFASLPHDTAREFMAEWLRQNGIRDFDRPAIERLVISAKTARAGSKFPILKGWHMTVNKTDLALQGPNEV
jgi:tRNA(Ile)-lysidine synthase